MPSIKQTSTGLGPLITVLVGPSLPRLDALKACGMDLPDPQVATMLIDTGATSTCLDPLIIKPLNLQPTGTCQIATPSTGDKLHECLTYDVSLALGSRETLFHVPTLAINICELAHQGIHGLLGRDVLDRCLLIYDGLRGEYILSY